MRNTVFVLSVFTILLSAVSCTQAAVPDSPSLSQIQIFPKDNIWNTRIDNLPVDAYSDLYIGSLIEDTGSKPALKHYIRNAIPYNLVNSSTPHQYVTGFCCNGAYFDNITYPIPENPLVEQGGSDRHMEIIDTDAMILYELSSASQAADSSWSARYGAVWDLTGNSFRKNNTTPMWAANEAGLPNLPGLVRFDEVNRGYIDHALRMGVPVMQNTWVWPARATAPLPSPDDPTRPPAGQRFRLKASYNISGFPPQARVILQALKTYGAMASTLTGKGNSVTLTGSPDSRWDYTDLNTLWRVNISDFEAVDVSSLMIDENSAQARQIPGDPIPTPTLTPVPTLSANPSPPPTTSLTQSVNPINQIGYEALLIACVSILGIVWIIKYRKNE